VLFSRPDVSTFINRNFEPVWESVRPVPLVRIDFGNGTVLTRTLHGNIATYVCAADGQVLDILPGIYDPPAYMHQLDQLRLLANYVDQQGKDQRAVRLKAYHADQAEALKANKQPAMFFNMADVSKSIIEGNIKAVLVPGSKTSRAIGKPIRASLTGEAASEIKFDSREDLAEWKVLREDGRRNETGRRRQIHEMLAAAVPVKPAALTKRLYKEVLHADLDDPYLGLGPVLFANYAFAREDKAR
jgi:hypothetical protein